MDCAKLMNAVPKYISGYASKEVDIHCTGFGGYQSGDLDCSLMVCQM